MFLIEVRVEECVNFYISYYFRLNFEMSFTYNCWFSQSQFYIHDLPLQSINLQSSFILFSFAMGCSDDALIDEIIEWDATCLQVGDAVSLLYIYCGKVLVLILTL